MTNPKLTTKSSHPARRVIALAALAIAATLPAAALAAQPWSPPQTVLDADDSPPGVIAFSGDGRALAAQSQEYALAGGNPRVTLATRTLAGRYLQFREVVGEVPEVVAYGQTRAVLLRYLVDTDAVARGGIARVGVSYGRTSGDIDPIKVIDRFRVFFDGPPQMAASEDGRLALAYNDRTEGKEALRLAVREPGDNFEQRAVGPAGSEDFVVDIGSNGDIVVAWRDRADNRVRARVQRRGHSLGRVEDLGPAEETTTLDASVADDGQVAVVWSAVDAVSSPRGSSGARSPVIVQAAIRPSGPHLFEPTQALYDSGERREVLTDLAIDSSGASATVAWTASQIDAQGAKRFEVLTATTNTARRFSAPTSIAADGTVKDLAVGSDGSATVAWTPFRVDEQGDRLIDDGLFAVRRPATGAAFGPTETVSNEQLSFARLALNPRDGRPTMVWNGTGDTAQQVVLRASTRE